MNTRSTGNIAMLRRTILALCLLTLCLPAGAGALSPAQEALRRAVEMLSESPAIGDEPVADFRLLSDFYARGNFQPAWTDPGKVGEMMVLVRNAGLEGLTPSDYHLEKLEALTAEAARGGQPSADQKAELDIVLTDALARYTFHVRFGKVDPSELDATWNFSRELAIDDPVGRLRATVEAPVLREAVLPPYVEEPAYRAYRHSLETLRRIRDAGGWPVIPQGPVLKAGTEDPRTGLIRGHLTVTGDLVDASGEDGPVYGPALAEAVERFQRRHGLAADGILGPATLAAMNVPVQARIDQVRVNMERLRWVFRDIEDEFIIVNIAGFNAHHIRSGRIDWSTRVVVGRPYRQTPVFKAKMTYLVFNPTWTVPPTILKKDVLPQVRRDPGYLAANHMEVIDAQGRPVDPMAVDWSGSTIPYQIRQKPGPWNAMGLVKFMFPNEHFVFLHDTPNRQLFERADRTFSSGCIRTERPFDLAERLLEGQPGWERPAIDALIRSGRTQTVVLDEPITVMLLYWTVGFDENWGAVFFRDVYSRDAKVLKALDAPFRFRPPAGYEDAFGADSPTPPTGLSGDENLNRT
jgi:murein L,D-transpeptidase YcbB/YkuD